MKTKNQNQHKVTDRLKPEENDYSKFKTRITVQIFVDDFLKIDRLLQKEGSITKSEFIRCIVHNGLQQMEIPNYQKL